MKAKVLTQINAVIAFLLSMLGFSSCNFVMKYGTPNDITCKYGTPYAEIEATGKITNEENEPIKSARVVLKEMYDTEGYTDENGIYDIHVTDIFPKDSVSIVVSDTDGVYEPDSVRIKIDYDRNDTNKNDGFYEGKASINQDFRLKKNK